MPDVGRLAHRVVAALPGPVREAALLPVRVVGDRELRALTPMPQADRRLYVGPWNTAGQGWEWAHAAERHLPGVAAQNLWAQRAATRHLTYRADHVLSARAQRGHVRRIHGRRVLAEATHVVFESGRPVLADFHAGSMLDDLPALEDAGIRSAVVYHGSEIRDLREHAERYPHSPFRGPWDDYLQTLQSVVTRNRADLASFDGPVLVSTPDQLDVSDRAVWLPLVVDVDRFATTAPVLERDRPVVLHAPSNPRLKGGEQVREQMEALAARGLIDYRPMTGVPHDRMAEVIQGADVVLDQFALGATGVLAAEAMAAGRLVLAHVAGHVRDAMTELDGTPPPVLEATPDDVGEVVAAVAADPASYRDLAAQGPGWARRNHDGRRAAEVLDRVLLS